MKAYCFRTYFDRAAGRLRDLFIKREPPSAYLEFSTGILRDIAVDVQMPYSDREHRFPQELKDRTYAACVPLISLRKCTSDTQIYDKIEAAIQELQAIYRLKAEQMHPLGDDPRAALHILEAQFITDLELGREER